MDLTAPIKKLEKQLANVALARAAAEAGAEVIRRGTADALGGDLSMSRLNAGEAEFDTSRTTPKRVSIVGVGRTFVLADKGRQNAVRAHAAEGSALATPWGPRMSVEGSTWSGFDITAQYGSAALQAASQAFVDGIEWGN